MASPTPPLVDRPITGLADAAWNDGPPSPSAVGMASFALLKPNSALSSRPPVNGSLPDSIPSSKTCFLDLPPALIAEVFKHLDARDLSMISCVCSLFRGVSSDSHGWKNFYCERWGSPTATTSRGAAVLTGKAWKDLYLAREARSKAFLGRSQNDMMIGHTNAIRCVRMLPSANLVFTAGYDSILRIWDLEECSLVACSRPLGETLRAIALDMTLLVVGGTDAKIKVWRAVPDLSHIFDVSGAVTDASMTELCGHEGPITSLSMDEIQICSGSWDMTVKVWDRDNLTCIRTLNHGDWVWSISLRSQRLFTASGSDVYSWDIVTGECSRIIRAAHDGHVYAVECSRSGHFVFSGGEDGVIRMFENKATHKRAPTEGGAFSLDVICNEPIAFWHPHSGSVYALAFEDPWLISASADGFLAMIDIRKIIKRRRDHGSGIPKSNMGWAVIPTDAELPQRMLHGSNESLYTVDIGADRVVTGGQEATVRVWDFSRALEIEQQVQASRTLRHEQRLRRKQQKGKRGKQLCNMAENRDAVEVLPSWQRGSIKLKA